MCTVNRLDNSLKQCFRYLSICGHFDGSGHIGATMMANPNSPNRIFQNGLVYPSPCNRMFSASTDSRPPRARVWVLAISAPRRTGLWILPA